MTLKYEVTFTKLEDTEENRVKFLAYLGKLVDINDGGEVKLISTETSSKIPYVSGKKKS